MKCLSLPFTFALLLLSFCSLQAQKTEELFAAKTFQDGDFTLKYRIYVPVGLKPDQKVPLILFLHGISERGDDNLRQLRSGVPGILKYMQKNNIQAILLAPQVPAGLQWVDVPWTGDSHTMPEQPSVPMHATMALLDQSLEDLPINLSKVYVTGISMGGFGAWDILAREPGIFTAGLIICGGGDVAQAPKLKDVALAVFHGDQDKTVKPQRSRDMVEAVRKAGGHPLYMEYPGVAHNAWTLTYGNNEAMDWFFYQTKK